MADTTKFLICPACSQAMRKILVKSAGVYVDICTEGCGGIFFDNRELAKFDKIDSDVTEIEDVLKKEFSIKPDEEITRICPACNSQMVKIGSGVQNVIIDSCNICGATFLDYQELDKIRNKHFFDDKNSVTHSLVNNFDSQYSSKLSNIVKEVLEAYLD